MSHPNIEKLSHGLYALVRDQDRTILNNLRLSETILVNGKPRLCRDALVRCQVRVDGSLGIISCGYLFSEGNRDIYEQFYPQKQTPNADINLISRIRSISEAGGHLLFRIVLKHLCRGAILETLEVVEERLAYAVLDKICIKMLTIELLAYAFCVQECIKPSQIVIEQLCGTTQQDSRRKRIEMQKYSDNYKCLRLRQKHDDRTKEATCLPYEIFDHDLMKVPEVDVKSEEAQDSEHYLLVPPCADPRLCLLRKSLHMIDEVEVSKFVGKIGANIAPLLWKNDINISVPLSPLETVLMSTNQISISELEGIKIELDMPKQWGWKKTNTGHALTLPEWTNNRLLVYVRDILLSYRIRKLQDSREVILPRPKCPHKPKPNKRSSDLTKDY